MLYSLPKLEHNIPSLIFEVNLENHIIKDRSQDHNYRFEESYLSIEENHLKDIKKNKKHQEDHKHEEKKRDEKTMTHNADHYNSDEIVDEIDNHVV